MSNIPFDTGNYLDCNAHAACRAFLFIAMEDGVLESLLKSTYRICHQILFGFNRVDCFSTLSARLFAVEASTLSIPKKNPRKIAIPDRLKLGNRDRQASDLGKCFVSDVT